MTVKELYKAQYEEECSRFKDTSKYSWAMSEVFGLCTYDSSLDELFVKTIIEVCKVIKERTNFEYIGDRQNYIKYIQVCQLLNEFNWIEWGTSIRGAWFQGDRPRRILDEMEWWDPMTRHSIDGVPFTEENLYALIEFLEE